MIIVHHLVHNFGNKSATEQSIRASSKEGQRGIHIERDKFVLSASSLIREGGLLLSPLSLCSIFHYDIMKDDVPADHLMNLFWTTSITGLTLELLYRRSSLNVVRCIQH